MAQRLAEEHAEAQQDHQRHAGVGHEVGRDPKRIAPYVHVPLDVLAEFPGVQELRSQHGPEGGPAQSTLWAVDVTVPGTASVLVLSMSPSTALEASQCLRRTPTVAGTQTAIPSPASP